MGTPRFILFSFFCPFRAAPVAYGRSQARGPIRAVATGLRQSHINAGSELHLRPTPQLTATPDPQPTEQGQGSNPQPHGSQSDSLTTVPRRELLPNYFYCDKIQITRNLPNISGRNSFLTCGPYSLQILSICNTSSHSIGSHFISHPIALCHPRDTNQKRFEA